MIKRAIHLFPKFENINLIEEIRKTHDPLYNLIPPHITLVFPFESEIQAKDLEKHILTVLKNTASFILSLENKLHYNKDQCIFLKIEKGNTNIINIHKLLYTGILEKFKDDRYHYDPHVTVGNQAFEIFQVLKNNNVIKEKFEVLCSQVIGEIISQDEKSIIEFICPLRPF